MDHAGKKTLTPGLHTVRIHLRNILEHDKIIEMENRLVVDRTEGGDGNRRELGMATRHGRLPW